MLDDKAVKERTDTVIKMANVTGEAAKDVSSYMTAIWNNFDDGSKSIEYYADVITKLGAATAASSEEIAGGLEKFAAVGNTIGLSYEYATAMLTTIIDKTRQSEDIVGTALKTILARIQGLKLGEILEDGTDLNKYSSALASVGVQIKDTSGELRSMDDILDDLGAKWQTLGKDTQIALAQTVGGVRQYNQIVSLMENWDAFKANVNIASGAEGSLQEQADIHAESWEAAQTRVRAAAEAIYSSLIDEDFFISVDNVLESILGHVKNFIDGLGGIKGVISTLGTVFLTVFNDQIVASLKNITNNIKMMTKSGREEIINLQKEAQLQLVDLIQSDERGRAIAADAYKQEATAQLALLNNSKKLSTVEMSIADILMKQLQYRTDQQVNSGKEIEKADANLSRQEKLLKNFLNLNTKEDSFVPSGQMSYKDLMSEISELGQVLPLFNTLDQTLTKSSISLKDFKSAISSVPDASLPNKIGEAFSDLKKQILAVSDLTSAKNAWDAFFENISNREIQVETIIGELKANFEDLKQSNIVSPKTKAEYELLIKLFTQVKEAADELGKSLDDSAKAQLNSAAAAKVLQKFLEQTGVKILNTQEKIMIMARLASSISMIANQFKGLQEVLNDDNLSGGEKIIALLSVMGTSIPTVISLTQSLYELGKSNLAQAAIAKVAKTALEEEKYAAIKAKVASVGFGRAMLAILPQLLAIGAVFATLTFVVPKVIEYFNKKPEGLSDTLEKLKKQSENFKVSLNEAKQESENIKSIFDNYSSVRSALDNCTVGTSEWRDRLTEVKELEADIIAQNPQLMEFMKKAGSYGYNSKAYFTEAGQIDIEKVMTDYLDYQNNLQIGSTLGLISQEKAISNIDYLIKNQQNRKEIIDKFNYDEYNEIYGRSYTPGSLTKVGNENWGSFKYTNFGSSLAEILELTNWDMYQDVTKKEYIQGLSELIYRTGLQNNSATFEEAEEYLQSTLTEDEKDIYKLLLKEFNPEADTLVKILSENLGDDYTNLTKLYTTDLAASQNRQINTNAYLATLFSGYDLSSYSQQIQNAIFGNLGNIIADSMVTDLLNDEENILSTAISEYQNRKGVTLEKQEDGTYKSTDQDGNKIEGISEQEILFTSSKGNERIGQFDINEYIEKALESIPSTLQDFVLDNSFQNYTWERLQGIEDFSNNSTLESIYGQGYVNLIQSEIDAAIEYYKKLPFKLENLTFGNVQKYNNLGIDAKRIVFQSIDPDKYNEFLNLLDTNITSGSGYESFVKFLDLLKEFGVEVEEGTKRYDNLLTEFTKGSLKITGFSNVTSEIIQNAKTLASGGTVDEKTLSVLQNAGLDTDILSTYQGEEHLNEFISNYAEAVEQANKIKNEYLAFDPKENKYKYKRKDSKNLYIYEVLEAMGMTTKDFATRYGEANNPWELLAQEAGNQANQYDPEEAAAIFASGGTEYLDELDSLFGEGEEAIFNRYLEIMLKAQAEIEGWEIPNNFFAENEGQWLEAFEELSLGIRLGEGLSSLASNYTNWIIDGTGKQLLFLKESGTISSEQLGQLEQIRSTYANLFGIEDASEVTDEILRNLLSLEGLGGYDRNSIKDSINSALRYLQDIEGFNQEDVNVDKIINYIIDNQVTSLLDSFSEAEKTALEAYQNKDYSDINKRQIEALKERLSTIDTFDEKRQLAEELGYVDDEGMTEAGKELGYKTVRELILKLPNAIIEGMDEAATELDFDNLTEYANTFSKTILKRIYGFYGEDEITKGQAAGLEDLFKDVKNSKQANNLGKLIRNAQEAGASVDEIISAFSGIDWNEISPDELKATLAELNIVSEYDDTALWDLIQAMIEATEYTDKLTSALNKYSSLSDITDKLQNGEELSAEEYQQVANTMGAENAANAFDLTAEGNYRLNDEDNVNSVIMALREGMVQVLQDAKIEAENNVDRFKNFNLVEEEVLYKQDQNREGPTIAEYTAANAENVYERLGIAENETAQASLMKALSEENYSGLSALLEGLGTNLAGFLSVIQDVANQKLIESEEAIKSVPDLDFEKEILDQGFSLKQFELVKDTISEQNDELKDNEKLLNKVTLQQMRHTRGIETAQENIKDWTQNLKEGNETLKKGEAASSEFYDTAEKMGEVYADLFDVDTSDFSAGFKRSSENAELLEKALEGDQEALNSLQSLAMSDILAEAKIKVATDDGTTLTGQSLADRINAITQNAEIEDLKIGAELDSETFNSLLGDLRFNTFQAAQEMNEALGMVGLEGELVPYTAQGQAESIVRDDGQIDYIIDGEVVATQTASGEITQTNTEQTLVWGFKNAKKTSDPIKTGSGKRSGSGGGGGGRGGGGRRKPRAERKGDTDKERYRSVTNQLEDLTDAFDKVSKASDRAFGKSRVKLLQEQQAALKKLAATQQDYIDEINDYYEQDKKNLSQVTDFIGVDIQFDENGTITNFDEIQDAMIEEYNSHLNEKGKVIDMDEKKWAEYQKEWERIMGLIDQYDETQDKRKEALQQLQDYINQIYDLRLEEVTYAVDIDIEAAEDSLAILDYMLGRIEDDAWSAAEAIGLMGEKAQDMLHQNQTYSLGIRDILLNHTEDIKDSNGKVIHAADLTMADVEGFMKGDQAAIDKITKLGENNAFTEEEVQSLRDYHSSLLEMNESLLQLREDVFAKVIDSFEQFNEKMDDSISKMDHLSQITENYRNIIDIVGKKNLGISNALVEAMGQASVEQDINRVTATRTKMETISAEIAMAEEKLADAHNKGLKEDEKLWQDSIDQMKESLNEAEEDFMSSWEDALRSIREQYELAVSNAVETLSDALAGPLHGSLDELQEAFDRQNTIAERFLPDYEKIYELNKLNRDIMNSIDDTDNIRSKQELAELQSEINDLEESGAQLSRYQTEDLRRRYELKLAELALTESQNAKSQVQMSRSSDGSWSYVYTADEEQVAAAEQNYEDKLFAIQQANGEYINAMNDSLVQLQVEFSQKIEEIMLDETLSDEERKARVAETTAFYKEQNDYFSNELRLVLGQNQTLYEEDWTRYHELTGYKISDNENYITQFNETALGIETGFDTMEQFQQNFNDTIGAPDVKETLLWNLNNAYQMWKQNTEDAMTEAGTSIDSFKDKMTNDTKKILDESNSLIEQLQTDGELIKTEFNDITGAIQKWSDTYSATFNNIINGNTKLIESFDQILKKWSEYDDRLKNPPPSDAPPSGDKPDDDGGDDGDKPEPEPPDDGGDDEEPPEQKKMLGKITIKKGYQYTLYKAVKNKKGKIKDFESKNLNLESGTYEFDKINREVDKKFRRVHIPSKGWVSSKDPDNPGAIKFEKYDTGGYTGSWGSEGRVAMLHEKELVLNKNDTSNLLNAVGLIRQIAEIIDLNAYSSAGYGSTIAAFGAGNAGTLEQNVHITAEFPNATNREEIYAAFTDIVNLASQYANRK